MKYLTWVVIVIAFVAFLLLPLPNTRDIPRPIVTWSETNVWKVLTQDGPAGSSFYISKNTWITACHVVEDEKGVYVQAADRKHTVFVNITECNDMYDLALLEYMGDEPLNITVKPTVFAELGVKDRGKAVYAPGYPLGLQLMITTGHWQSREDSGNFISAPIAVGDSGSPALIIKNGRVKVVGIRMKFIHRPHLNIVYTPDKILEFLNR